MLLDLLKERYSCRRFSGTPIPEDSIRYLLECARLSPSGGNEQPWKIGVITDRALIGKIAEAASVNYPQPWIAGAPLLMVLCTQLFGEEEIGMRRFPSIHERLQTLDRGLYARINMEEHQTKLPGEHMVIAALEYGICSTWISSLDCEAVGELLGLRGYLVSNVIAFGYPAADQPPTPKKELAQIVFYNSFS